MTAMILSSGESLRRISPELGAGGVFEPEVENDEVDGALVLMEDLHALADRVGFEHGVLVVFKLAIKRLARHRLRVDEQPMVQVGFAAMD